MISPSYKIEKIISGGFGLSHGDNGQTTLIRGTIAKETVRARIDQKNKNVDKGVATLIEQASPSRVQPPCPLYGKCGGCDFQHMSYPCQLQSKRDILEELLQKSGSPLLHKAADNLLAPPIPSAEQFHYRQRIRLQTDQNDALGFYKYRSHNCVHVQVCLLAHPVINQFLQESHSYDGFRKLLPRTDSLEILYNPINSLVILLFHFKQKPRAADKNQAIALHKNSSLIQNIFFAGENFALSSPLSQNDSQIPTDLSISLPPFPPYTEKELTLSWESNGFCQVNIKQNENLIRTVLDFCSPDPNDTVLDLFCGMGNFSIPIAEQAASVLGIEGQGSSIRSARQNSLQAEQSNTEFIKSPIHTACKKLRQEEKRFDTIIIDPPRQGTPGLTKELSLLCNKRLIYISCDPATLCQDLRGLLEQNFCIKKLQPIDMFPQTHHIETVCLLEKTEETKKH